MSELLAPVGSWEALEAAVNNGADAVYLGGKLFSARQYASNFDEVEMARALDFAHLRGVKVCVTVNTIISDSELEPALDYLKFLYEAGADAIIIQDLGLATLARQVLPKLQLHASTQMTAHNLPGVLELEDRGFQRVVLAREVNLENIRHIHQHCQAELEVFVHGALCISYSGQCLMSSLIGGRSGNRGRCAQPCRLKYDLVDPQGRSLDKENLGNHLLSPKDLWMVDHLPELLQAGVTSFKIEGRMKRPEYVATVVRVYREAMDRALANGNDGNYAIDDSTKKQLFQIFNRDFSKAHFFTNPGRDLMSYKRPNNRGLRLGRVDEYDFKRKTVTISLEEDLGVGDGVEFWISQGGRQGVVVKELWQNGQKVQLAPAGTQASFEVVGKIRPGDRVFKTSDAALIGRAQETFGHQARELGRISIIAEVEAQIGQPLKIVLRDSQGNVGGGRTNFIAETAIKRPLTEEVVRQQVDRLGNTPFTLQELRCQIGAAVMVPMSEINEARRQAVESLTENRLASFRRSKVNDWKQIKVGAGLSREFGQNQDYSPVTPKGMEKGDRSGNVLKSLGVTVTVGDLESVKEAVRAGANTIYFGGENYRSKPTVTVEQFREASELCRKRGVRLVAATPRILSDVQLDAYMQKLTKIAPYVDGVQVGNLGLLRLVRELDKAVYADFGFNTFNWYSAKALGEAGVVQVTLSPELTLQQINELNHRATGVQHEVIVQGHLPMMISEYCAPGAVAGGRTTEQKCSKPCKSGSFGLKDRLSLVFPIETDEYCRMHIFNPKELSMIENIAELVAAGVGTMRLELKKETPRRVGQLVSAYSQELQNMQADPEYYQVPSGLKAKLEADTAGFTKGHFYRGVM